VEGEEGLRGEGQEDVEGEEGLRGEIGQGGCGG
jgi:hypothetical protein